MSEETIKPMMSERTKLGLEILQAAVLLGILGDVLLRATPWGLNVLLFILALVAAYDSFVFRRRHEFWNIQTIALHAALIFLRDVCLARFDGVESCQYFCNSHDFSCFEFVGIENPTQLAGVFHYGFGWIWSGINAAFAPFALVGCRYQLENYSANGLVETSDCRVSRFGNCNPDFVNFWRIFYGGGCSFSRHYRENLQIDFAILFTHILFAGFFRGEFRDIFAVR